MSPRSGEEDEVDVALRRYAEKKEAAGARPARARPTESEPRPSAPLMRGARKPACMAFLASAVLLGINAQSISNSGTFFVKPLAFGVMIFPIAVAMFFFPGRVDLPALTTRHIPLGEVLGGLAWYERLVWLGATVLGILAGAYVVVAL